MKLTVTAGGSLITGARTRRLPEAVAARLRQRLASDAETELAFIASEFSGDPDPEQRRDALERAVRRLWGTTL